MDGRQVISIYRQITVRYNIVNQPADTSHLVAVQARPKKKNGNIHAVIVLIHFAISISVLVIGALHLNECPAQKMIPLSMTILGAMFLLERVLNCIHDMRQICGDDDDDTTTPSCLLCINLLSMLARFGLFIALCYWVFTLNYTSTPGNLPIQNYTSVPVDHDLSIQGSVLTTRDHDLSSLRPASTTGDPDLSSISSTSAPGDHDLLYCKPSFYKTAFGGCIAGLVLYSLSLCCCFISAAS